MATRDSVIPATLLYSRMRVGRMPSSAPRNWGIGHGPWRKLVCILLFAAIFVSLTHFHPGSDAPGTAPCTICVTLHALHAAAPTGVPAALLPPRPVTSFVVTQHTSNEPFRFSSSLFTRPPPAL